MARYRFYFLNAENHMGAVVENAACSSDSAAAKIAIKLLGKQPKHTGIEIREGLRSVSRHYRSQVPAPGFLKRAARYFLAVGGTSRAG